MSRHHALQEMHQVAEMADRFLRRSPELAQAAQQVEEAFRQIAEGMERCAANVRELDV